MIYFVGLVSYTGYLHSLQTGYLGRPQLNSKKLQANTRIKSYLSQLMSNPSANLALNNWRNGDDRSKSNGRRKLSLTAPYMNTGTTLSQHQTMTITAIITLTNTTVTATIMTMRITTTTTMTIHIRCPRNLHAPLRDVC